MSLEDSYLAGMLDGDGCFLVERRKYKKTSYYYPSIKLGLKSRKTIETIAERYDIEKVYSSKNGMFMLVFYGEKAKEILERVMPYLITKKNQAIVLKDFFENSSFVNQRFYYEKMKELKVKSYLDEVQEFEEVKIKL